MNGGAIIEASKFELGDPSLSIRELWSAEYQESDAILIDPKKIKIVDEIAKRENCNYSIVGKITGDRIVSFI